MKHDFVILENEDGGFGLYVRTTDQSSNYVNQQLFAEVGDDMANDLVATDR